MERNEISPLADFIAKSGNNADMPLDLKSRPAENFICNNLGVLCTSMGGMQHDNLSSLPLQVQKVIEDIKLASSIEEKAIIAHNFANVYVKYVRGHSTNSFDEIAESPKGDCDNFAILKAGLLIHGGVAPENIFLAGGDVRYDDDKAGGHAFVIVADEEDFLYLDNNFQDIEKISPEIMTVNGYLYTPDSRPDDKEITATIDYFAKIEDGKGQLFKSDEAYSRMVDRTKKEVYGRWWENLKSVFVDSAEIPKTNEGTGSELSQKDNAMASEKANSSETPNPHNTPAAPAARQGFHP